MHAIGRTITVFLLAISVLGVSADKCENSVSLAVCFCIETWCPSSA